jgi:protein regulator of cytokinesis 1
VLKSERIGHFVASTRIELQEFWDKCYYSREERDKFEPFYSQDYTEDLLDKHEAEVEAIKTYYLDNVALFAKVEKRQQLWWRMVNLQELQKDPQRLKKAKGMQLLIEEKDKKRIQKQLPKIQEELREEMDRFEEETGALFLVGGMPYKDFIECQVADQVDKKEEERGAKAKAKKEQNIHETIYGTVTPAKGMKRKMATSGATPYNDSKRAKPATTSNLLGLTGAGNFTRSMVRSPFKTKSSANLSTRVQIISFKL